DEVLVRLDRPAPVSPDVGVPAPPSKAPCALLDEDSREARRVGVVLLPVLAFAVGRSLGRRNDVARARDLAKLLEGPAAVQPVTQILTLALGKLEQARLRGHTS